MGPLSFNSHLVRALRGRLSEACGDLSLPASMKYEEKNTACV